MEAPSCTRAHCPLSYVWRAPSAPHRVPPAQVSWALVPDSKPLMVGKLGSHLSTCWSPKAGTTAPISLHTSPGWGRPSDPHSQMWF